MPKPVISLPRPAPYAPELALELLPLARGSLYYAALHATAAGHPDAARALDLASEQSKLLERIATLDLIPFDSSAELAERRTWLDAAIERHHDKHPLLARYLDLHEMRREFLPLLH